MLRSRNPLTLEADAFAADEPEMQREVLLHAAASRFFAPKACRALAQMWSSRSDNQAAEIADYWQSICAFLPLDPPPGSPAALFYAAQELEARQAVPEAFELYLKASDGHPLAAASVARLGGHLRRLDGWKRYNGAENRAVTALKCLAIAMHCLRLCYDNEEHPDAATAKARIPKMQPDVLSTGFTAAGIAIELGASEAALIFASCSVRTPFVFRGLAKASHQCFQASCTLRHYIASLVEVDGAIETLVWRRWALVWDAHGWGPSFDQHTITCPPYGHRIVLNSSLNDAALLPDYLIVCSRARTHL